MVDVNDSEGEQTAAAIRDSGGEALYQHADVSSSAESEAMIRKAEEKFGALHIIFNNAGIMDSRDDNAMVTEEDVWDLTMAINLKGVFLAVNSAYLLCSVREVGRSSTQHLLSG